MRFSQILSGLALAGYSTAICVNPEPSRRICYNEEGGTPQDVNLKEADFIARYLRSYQAQAIKEGRSPFWKMNEADADNCAEWQVSAKGKTWALAKLVGDDSAAVTFNDIANTIDPGVNAPDSAKDKAIVKCGTAGGQMGVIVNTADPLYQSKEFIDGGYTNQGIVIKLVHSP
ncbi:hypothetical protein NQ176_g9955 [Zarea fungicola]|uniref:Uncharacterized protein n=1 Tax=Zarea fungicola TaxID=93591 RepID=A0ACC1MJD6_9HYPO|nr:hypothetical protein NQ176_g9955 [Lecanicillium fungicola]